MTTILVTTLIVVLVFGIPLGIVIGRASAKKKNRAGTEPAPAGTNASTAKSPWSTTWLWGSLILGAVIFFGALWMHSQGMLDNISIPWSTSTGLLIAAILLLTGMLLPIKKPEWLKRMLTFAGVLVLALTLASSGFGRWTGNLIEGAEACAGYGDCSRRAFDVPVVNGGTVNIRPGDSQSFQVIGTVALVNHVNHCLNVAPDGVFDQWETPNAEIIYIRPWSGEKEWVTVTSKPRHRCN